MDKPSFKKILARNILFPLAMSVALLLVLVSVVFALLNANQDIARQDALIEKETEALKLIVDAETGLRGFLLAKRDYFLEPYLAATEQLPERLLELERLAIRPGHRGEIQRVKDIFANWVKNANASINQVRKNGATNELFADMDSRKEQMDQIRTGFEDMQRKGRERRTDLMLDAEKVTRVSLVITAIITLLLGSLLAYAGRRQLLGLSSTYETSLGELSKQAWIRTGQASLAENIRGELVASGLAEKMLGFVTDYTRAVVGAIYLPDSSHQFKRAAQYAFFSKNAVDAFRLGEGLVGQVARDQKPLWLDNVPEDYVRVKSGTGETKPRYLAVIPLVADRTIQGVMEVGYLDPPPAEVKEFLFGTLELMGGFVRTRAYQERQQQLLQESQQLAEELQTQQEELRVSNEELEERTRILQDPQARLESQHAELEQTNEQLEEQTSLLEEQKRNLDIKNNALTDAQAELEQKAREVESASRYKSEFMANMSHELRTPLNSSLILAKLLKDNPTGNLSPEQVEFANTIYAAGNDLLLLINDILDLSKVEAGKLEINPDRLPLAGLLEQLERTFQPLARDKGLELRMKLDPDVPAAFTSDRQRVEQILKNLLSNALKFTRAGYVELSVGVKAGKLYFRVKDTGIGIDPSQHDLIFEAFRQADGTTSRKYGGTGLGLSISRTLAALLGGQITLESTPGQGSAFTLQLPVEFIGQTGEQRAALPHRGPAASPSPKEKPAGEKRSAGALPPLMDDDRTTVSKGEEKLLLLVEDEPRYARILLDVAHDCGFKCLLASNNETGFELAKDFLPRAILLDIRLPDGSGLSLLDRLKREPATRHIPVHGMSVSDYSREALHLGAANFAIKPSDREEIRKIMQRIEEKARSRTKSILLVEDDAVQRSSVERLIATKGLQIVAVESGEKALAQLKMQAFDCMIIDLKLPDMTGFELLEQMSHNSGATFPPVIVYTGRQLSSADEDNLYRYSRSIIIKGARSPERLLDEVTLFLHQSEADLPAESQRMLKSSRNRERAFEGRTVLVVDDDVRNIFALTNAIELKGATAAIARNGREALEKIEQMPEIDLVLMDIMMPEMDGLEAMRRIRASSSRKDIPIIAITAKAMQNDYEQCLEAGASDYLAKPVDVDRLMSLIRVWLPKHLVMS